MLLDVRASVGSPLPAGCEEYLRIAVHFVFQDRFLGIGNLSLWICHTLEARLSGAGARQGIEFTNVG